MQSGDCTCFSLKLFGPKSRTVGMRRTGARRNGLLRSSMMNEQHEEDEREAPEEEKLSDEELDDVSGGVAKTPSPGGPVPIPYPNVTD
jgi:hypothetical protein